MSTRLFGALPSRRQRLGEHMRRDLSRFFRESWHVLEPQTPLVWGRHIEVMCDEVQGVFEEWRTARKERRPHRFQNLLINTCPGTAKSRILNVAAPVWMWLDTPDWRLTAVSGNPRVALRDSMYRRQLLESEWFRDHFSPLWKLRSGTRDEYEEMVEQDPELVDAWAEAEADEALVPLLDWRLAKDQNAKSLFKNDAGGHMLAISIGAKITGDRGDALIVDDPNDVNRSNSKVELQNVNDWWKAAGNRLNDLTLGVRVCVQQRVAEEDFSGQALREGNWRHVRLPVIYDAANDCRCPSCSRGDVPDWRAQDGEEPNLLPARFTPAVLEEERGRLGAAGFSAQYHQNPVPSDGETFKAGWWRFWRHDHEDGDHLVPVEKVLVLPEKFEATAISIDCSFKKTNTSDLVAIGRWGRLAANRYLLQLRWERMSFKATVEAILEMLAEDAWPVPDEILVEDKANGPAVIDVLKEEIPGIIPVNPTDSKEARATVTAPLVEAGNVVIPLHWAKRAAYIAEHSAFPGAHDDAVDQQSQVLLRWKTAKPPARLKFGFAGGKKRSA